MGALLLVGMVLGSPARGGGCAVPEPVRAVVREGIRAATAGIAPRHRRGLRALHGVATRVRGTLPEGCVERRVLEEAIRDAEGMLTQPPLAEQPPRHDPDSPKAHLRALLVVLEALAEPGEAGFLHALVARGLETRPREEGARSVPRRRRARFEALHQAPR